MAYANPTSKRTQVLDQLVANLSAISTPTYSTTPARVMLYRSSRIALGGQMPMIAVIPVEDTRTRAFTCAQDEYQMRVEIVCVERNDPTSTNDWHDSIALMVGDVQQALANDRQLSGEAVYIEVESTDISDMEMEGNRVLAVGTVSAVILYRVSTTDVTV
jgi:hypothetical protein